MNESTQDDVLLSIIIVSYKNYLVLKNCIDSICKHEDRNKLEIIIIDNSPSKELIYENVVEEYPDVVVRYNDNKGFGEGNNRGAELSHGEILLFLNADTYILEPTLVEAAEKLANSDVSLMGVKLLTTSGKWGFSFFYMLRYDLFHNILIKYFNKTDTFNPQNMYIAGADLFVKREAFFKAGMFDENIFMYLEEPDLIWRVKKIGGRIGYFPQYSIVHIGGASSDESSKSSEAIHTRLASLKYFTQKYNLNINKILAGEIRLYTMKLIIAKTMRKRNDIKKYDEIIKLIKSYKRA